MERRRVLIGLVGAIPMTAAALLGVRSGRRGIGTGPDGAGTSVAPPAAPLDDVDTAGPATDHATDPATDGSPQDTGGGATQGPDVAPVEVLCRDAVGLAAALAGGVVQTPTRVTVHHSAVVLEDVRRAPAQLRAFQRDHQRRGWTDVAYHLAVDPAGLVYELRDPGIAGESSTPYDTVGHLQVLCLGDYDRQEPTPELIESVARLVAAECAARGLSVRTVTAHRDHVLTWCPGDALYARMEGIVARADELLRAGAPALRAVCGEEGRARVAAIEAGP